MKKGIPVNIAIQMVDSQSLANFQRQAVKTMAFLENDDDAFIFESNSILGDGTPAQIMPLLTGIFCISIMFIEKKEGKIEIFIEKQANWTRVLVFFLIRLVPCYLMPSIN